MVLAIWCLKNTTNGYIYSSNSKISIYGTPHEEVACLIQKRNSCKKPAGQMEILIDKREFIDKVYENEKSFVLKPARDGLVAKSYLCKYKNGILVQKNFYKLIKKMDTCSKSTLYKNTK